MGRKENGNLMLGIVMINRNSAALAFPELQRASAHVAFELACKGTVVVETAVESDLGDSLDCESKLIGGNEDAQAYDVFPRGDAKASLEKAFHLPLGNPGLSG